MGLRRDGAVAAAARRNTTTTAAGDQEEQQLSSSSSADGSAVHTAAAPGSGELTELLREGRRIIVVNTGFKANGGEGELPPPAIGQSGGQGEGQGIPGSDQQHESDLIGQSKGTKGGESPIRLAEREEGREEQAAAGSETLRAEITAHVEQTTASAGDGEEVASSPSLSSSDSSDSGMESDDFGSQSESSVGDSSDTGLEGRDKWVAQGAEEANGQEGFEHVVRRASKRLAKKQR